jgi:cytochrome c-type biogenesis protein CcmH/NrfF
MGLGSLKVRCDCLQPAQGIGAVAWFWGVLLILIALGVLVFFGRRRQKAARARASEQRAAALGGRR